MAQEKFQITVGVSDELPKDDETAVAEAVRYLTNEDRTDLFGDLGRAYNVTVHDGEEMDYSVTIEFQLPLSEMSPDEFVDKIEGLYAVEQMEFLGRTYPHKA